MSIDDHYCRKLGRGCLSLYDTNINYDEYGWYDIKHCGQGIYLWLHKHGERWSCTVSDMSNMTDTVCISGKHKDEEQWS